MEVVTIRWAREKLWSISVKGVFSINGERRGQLRVSMGRAGSLPWRVRVMDCSSFSNSSVSVKLRWDEVLALDILNFGPDWQMYH